jgi:hypothetical protein
VARDFFWQGEAGSGLIQSLSLEDGKVLSEVYDPNRNAAMGYIADMRSSADIQDMSWGRWQLSIPELDLMLLKRKYPELNSKDNDMKTRAWKRFLASSESKPYRVH